MYIFGMPTPEWTAANGLNCNIGYEAKLFDVCDHSMPTSDVIP